MVRPSLFIAGCAALLAGQSVLADTLTLNNGSVVVGTIDYIAGGKVGVKTEFAGDILVDLESVQGITTDDPRTIALSSGNVLVGLLDYTDGQQVVRSEDFGNLDIRTADLTSMATPGSTSRRVLQPKDGETPDEAAVREEYEQQVAEIQKNADAEISELQERVDNMESVWKGTLDFGLSGTTGASERFNLNVGAEAIRETSKDLTRLHFRANWATENGENTQNEVIGGGEYEYNLTHKWFLYGRGFIEYDQFENLDIRVVPTGGIGYYWIRNDKTQFKTQAGAGYRYESYNSPSVQVSEGVLDFGYELRTELWEHVDLVHGGTYTPSLDDFSQFRLTFYTTIDWELAELNWGDNWFLRGGLWNKYNSDPQPGIPNWESTYMLGLAYKF